MGNNRTKVESNAINVIRGIVDKSTRLLPDPSFGDRGISTDGNIQFFKNGEVELTLYKDNTYLLYDKNDSIQFIG